MTIPWFEIPVGSALFYLAFFAPSIIAYLRDEEERMAIWFGNICLWLLQWVVAAWGPRELTLIAPLATAVDVVYLVVWALLLYWSVFGRRLTLLRP